MKRMCVHAYELVANSQREREREREREVDERANIRTLRLNRLD